jgi:anaerobic selenocysteine-containing dehydrogenase
LKHGDRIDVESRMGTMGDGAGKYRVQGFIAVQYDIPRGSTAMYYPEGNCLVPLDSHDPKSGTPAYKSIPVTIRAARDTAERAA